MCSFQNHFNCCFSIRSWLDQFENTKIILKFALKFNAITVCNASSETSTGKASNQNLLIVLPFSYAHDHSPLRQNSVVKHKLDFFFFCSSEIFSASRHFFSPHLHDSMRIRRNPEYSTFHNNWIPASAGLLRCWLMEYARLLYSLRSKRIVLHVFMDPCGANRNRRPSPIICCPCGSRSVEPRFQFVVEWLRNRACDLNAVGTRRVPRLFHGVDVKSFLI